MVSVLCWPWVLLVIFYLDVLFLFWTAKKFAIALCMLHLEVSVVHNGWQSQSMKVALALAIILPALAAKLPRTSRVCFYGKGSHKDRPHVVGQKQNTEMWIQFESRFGSSLNCQHVQRFFVVELGMLTTRSDSLEPGKVMGSWDKRERYGHTQHSHAFALSVAWTFFRKTCQLKSHEHLTWIIYEQKCILMLPRAPQITAQLTFWDVEDLPCSLASAQAVLRGIPSDHQTVYGVRKPMWINTWTRELLFNLANRIRSQIWVPWGFLVALTISFLGSTSQRRALQLDSPQYHWPWHCGIHVPCAILAWEKYKDKF